MEQEQSAAFFVREYEQKGKYSTAHSLLLNSYTSYNALWRRGPWIAWRASSNLHLISWETDGASSIGSGKGSVTTVFDGKPTNRDPHYLAVYRFENRFDIRLPLSDEEKAPFFVLPTAEKVYCYQTIVELTIERLSESPDFGVLRAVAEDNPQFDPKLVRQRTKDLAKDVLREAHNINISTQHCFPVAVGKGENQVQGVLCLVTQIDTHVFEAKLYLSRFFGLLNNADLHRKSVWLEQNTISEEEKVVAKIIGNPVPVVGFH